MVDSDFWEQCGERFKKLSNVHWLSFGGALSALLWVCLLSSAQSSTVQQLELSPYQISVIPLKSTHLASRTLQLSGNVNATKVYVTNQCPVFQVVEEQQSVKQYDVRHRGRTDDDFNLVTGNVVSFKAESQGDVMVKVFESKQDEVAYQKHTAQSGGKAIFQGTVVPGDPVEHTFTAEKTSLYVFLYEGMSADSVEVTYDIVRYNYNVKDWKDDPKKGCTYLYCAIALPNRKSCVSIENVNVAHGVSMSVKVNVNNHHFWMLLLSLMPVAAAAVYIKYGKEPNLVVSRSGGMRMPGYELVDNEQF